MEWQYSGENAYLLLLKNPSCPTRDPTYDSGGSNLVSQNGVVYVSTSYAFPFDSFGNVIRFCPPIAGGFIGIIINMDTGEGRIYDGSQGVGINADPSIHYTVPQAAIGLVKSFDISITKKLQSDGELGQMYVNHQHSAGLFDYTVNLNKVAIDRTKMSAGDKTSPALEQYSIFGHGLVELDEYVRQLESDYYICVLYIHDFSGDPANVAQNFVFPCTAFENIKIASATERVINLTATGKPTYMRSAPFDTILSNNLAWSPLECEPVELVIEDTTDGLFRVGDGGGQEEWLGEVITTVGGFSLYAVGVWIHNIDFTPADMILRLYQAPGGALISSSNPIPYDEISFDVETLFYFPLPPLAAVTAYFITLETTAGSIVNATYWLQGKSAFGAGDAWWKFGPTWPPAGIWFARVDFDLRMTLYGCEP